MFMKRPGQGDHYSLPPGMGRELLRRTAALVQRVFARHLHVAAKGKGGYPVVGVAPAESNQPFAKTDGKDLDSHPKQLGGSEMTPFMDQDHDRQDEENRDDAVIESSCHSSGNTLRGTGLGDAPVRCRIYSRG